MRIADASLMRLGSSILVQCNPEPCKTGRSSGRPEAWDQDDSSAEPVKGDICQIPIHTNIQRWHSDIFRQIRLGCLFDRICACQANGGERHTFVAFKASNLYSVLSPDSLATWSRSCLYFVPFRDFEIVAELYDEPTLRIVHRPRFSAVNRNSCLKKAVPMSRRRLRRRLAVGQQVICTEHGCLNYYFHDYLRLVSVRTSSSPRAVTLIKCLKYHEFTRPHG